MLYLFGLNLGAGPLPWLMNGEMYSEEAKGTSSSIATTTHWTATFLITRFAANIEEAITPAGSYFLYAGLTVGSSLFVALVVPETKGKSPLEMKAYFMGKTEASKDLHGVDNQAAIEESEHVDET